jgi:hypothetical protein
MRKLALQLGLTMALVLPGSASASVIDFSGSFPGTMTKVSFEVVKHHGHLKKIRNFSTKDLAVSCTLAGDQSTASNDPSGYPIKGDGTFKRPEQDPSAEDQSMIRGRFVHRDKRAHGVFRFDVDNGVDHCVSPKLHWKAHRT